MVRGSPCPRKQGPPPAAAATLPPKPKAQSAPSRAATQPVKAPGAASAKASGAASGAASDNPNAQPRAATVASVAVKSGGPSNLCSEFWGCQVSSVDPKTVPQRTYGHVYSDS